MNCQDADKNLEDWLVKSLTMDEELAVSQHLLSCRDCRLQVRRLEQIQERLPQVLLSDPEPRASHVGPWALSAALILIGILIGSQTSEYFGVQNEAQVKAGINLVRQSPDAKFQVMGLRHIDLEQGEIEVNVDAGEPECIVSTSLGEVSTCHARFVVSLEVKKMEAKTLAGAGGILTVGVIIGSVMFGPSDGDKMELGKGETVTTSSPDSGAVGRKAIIPRRNFDETLEAGVSSNDPEIIRRLQDEVRSLQQKDALNRERIAALKGDTAKLQEELARQQKEADMGEEPPPEKVGPRQIAEFLGLEASREEALVQAYDKLQDKIREQEKLLAEVEETDGGYKIEIPAWPDEWKQLQKDWQRDLAGILMPQEMKVYDGNKMSRQLFRDEGGNSKRSITIAPGTEGYTLEETRSGNGMMMKSIDDGIPTLDDALTGLTHIVDK